MVAATIDKGGAPDRGVNVRPWLAAALPVAAALAYPWLLAGVSTVAQPSAPAPPPGPTAVIATAAAILLCAAVVMGMGTWAALIIKARSDATAVRTRLLALFAFSVPSMLTAVGNIAGLWHARAYVALIWPLLWTLTAAAVALAPASPGGFTQRRYRNIVVAHAVSACAILAAFLLLHLGDHLAGLWSGPAHAAVMTAIRHVYRNPVIEPALFALLLVQILSGILLLRRRLAGPMEPFGILQALTGFYVAVYLVSHVTAVLAARAGGTDTNWDWVTGHDRGLLFHLSGSPLVAHYWVGPIAIVAHLALGLRAVLLEHGVSARAAGQAAGGLIGTATLASTAILAGLLGFHLA